MCTDWSIDVQIPESSLWILVSVQLESLHYDAKNSNKNSWLKTKLSIPIRTQAYLTCWTKNTLTVPWACRQCSPQKSLVLDPPKYIFRPGSSPAIRSRSSQEISNNDAFKKKIKIKSKHYSSKLSLHQKRLTEFSSYLRIWHLKTVYIYCLFKIHWKLFSSYFFVAIQAMLVDYDKDIIWKLKQEFKRKLLILMWSDIRLKDYEQQSQRKN